MDKPLVILEIANNHMGDLNHLKNIISTYYTLTFRYKKIINFAIKFQFRNLKSFIHPTANKNNKGVKRFAFSSKNFDVIKTLAPQSLTIYSTSSGCKRQLIAV